MIRFLICVCWHPERICRALSSWAQRGQVRLVECLNHTACFWLYRVSVLFFEIMHLVLTGILLEGPWPLVNKQATNVFWNNSNLKFYEKRYVMRYRTGTILNQKHAYRYGFSPNANCPICPCTGFALHILSGCQHTKMRNMIIKRHNTASVLIV